MELTPYELALIGLGSTVAGTLIGAWISYRLTLQLSIITAKKDASRKFIAIFHNELTGLYPYPINWPKNIDSFLRSKFNILNAAVGEFRHYLPSEKREDLDKAWFSFYNATGRKIDNESCQCYLHYEPFMSSSLENGKEVTSYTTKTYKETFKHNVDNLLKFAELQ